MKRQLMRSALGISTAAALAAAGCAPKGLPETPTAAATTWESPGTSSIPPPGQHTVIHKLEFIPGASKHPTEKIFKLLDVIGGGGQTINVTDIAGQRLDSRQEGDQFPVECVTDGGGASSTGVILLRTPTGEGTYDVIGPGLAWFSFEALQYALANGVAACSPGTGELMQVTPPT